MSAGTSPSPAKQTHSLTVLPPACLLQPLQSLLSCPYGLLFWDESKQTSFSPPTITRYSVQLLHCSLAAYHHHHHMPLLKPFAKPLPSLPLCKVYVCLAHFPLSAPHWRPIYVTSCPTASATHSSNCYIHSLHAFQKRLPVGGATTAQLRQASDQ